MAFTEITSLDAEQTTALGGTNRKTGKKNPTQVEGYYLGSRKVESKKSKSGFAAIHFFQTPKGNLGVWGKTDMDRKLEGVTPGSMVRVTWTGMQATPNGEMYKYKVEADKDNTIEVSTPATNSYYEEEPTPTASEDDDLDDEETDDTDEYQSSAATASASALERKKKVEALLSGKSRK